ncbi:uncharacterized protein IUM83_02600 [Phytophthora cinnamomi]|uniref:uncharacterized protein n=1 Tax=Phytophthora cinnamomi TaxID=4785 RepID=UPI00355A5532|nr:hypothetical protein IUM83_02600 [Phytophthora cinnamomi]
MSGSDFTKAEYEMRLHSDGLVAPYCLLPNTSTKIQSDPPRDYPRGKCASRSAICNYVGWNRDKVTAKYQGCFCAAHLSKIDDLRQKIMAVTRDKDQQVQIPLGYNEIFLRKFLDDGHVQFYSGVVVGAPTVHVKGQQLSCKGSRTAHVGPEDTRLMLPRSGYDCWYAHSCDCKYLLEE